MLVDLTECERGDCGRPATHATRDLREVAPRRDAGGSFLWFVYEPAGPWRPRCNEHPREPRTFDRDGQVVTRLRPEA